MTEALGGGRPSQRFSIMRSVETIRPASSKSSANTVLCFGGPSDTSAPARSTCRGPRIRNSKLGVSAASLARPPANGAHVETREQGANAPRGSARTRPAEIADLGASHRHRRPRTQEEKHRENRDPQQSQPDREEEDRGKCCDPDDHSHPERLGVVRHRPDPHLQPDRRHCNSRIDGRRSWSARPEASGIDRPHMLPPGRRGTTRTQTGRGPPGSTRHGCDHGGRHPRRPL